MHTPVLSKEVIHYLAPADGKRYVDCTLNGGGHTSAILEAAPQARVLGIEWDPAIARAFVERHPELTDRVTVVNDTYTNLPDILRTHAWTPDGILFDLGLSSMHYESGRGFSFQKDEPLDMRFNPETNPTTAAEILNTSSQSVLADMIRTLGDEQFADAISESIVARRPLQRTSELVTAIEAAVPAWYRHRKIHCATKTFQALRIAVNHELENVRTGIIAAIDALPSGGRLLVIAFQGDEDRIVRELFKEYAHQGIIRWVTRSTVRPSWDEIQENPRSRSAKLKIIEKI